MDPLLVSFLVAFGALTGVLSALLGVGGGIFMVPALVLVAAFDQQEAQATSLLVIVPTAAVATWALRRQGIGELKLAARLGVLGVLGGVGGAAAALAVSGAVLRYAFALLLVVVAARLLVDSRRGTPVVDPSEP